MKRSVRRRNGRLGGQVPALRHRRAQHCLSVDSFVRIVGTGSHEFGLRQIDMCRVLS